MKTYNITLRIRTAGTCPGDWNWPVLLDLRSDEDVEAGQCVEVPATPRNDLAPAFIDSRGRPVPWRTVENMLHDATFWRQHARNLRELAEAYWNAGMADAATATLGDVRDVETALSLP